MQKHRLPKYTKVIAWIVLIWTILAVPYMFEGSDPSAAFFSVVYLILLSWLAILVIRGFRS